MIEEGFGYLFIILLKIFILKFFILYRLIKVFVIVFKNIIVFCN